jgi:hypothetical protein
MLERERDDEMRLGKQGPLKMPERERGDEMRLGKQGALWRPDRTGPRATGGPGTDDCVFAP